MLTEGSGPVLLAMGLVFALLLGEIDLSAGFAGGVCAAVMVRLMVGYDMPWPVTIGAALLTGVVIGLLIGFLRAKVRIPSFVVTLAFFLAFQGVALYIVNNGPGQHGDVAHHRLGRAGVRELPDAQVGRLAAGHRHGRGLRVRQAQLAAGPPPARSARRADIITAAKIGLLTVGAFGFVYVLNQNRSINSKPIPTNVDGQIKFVTPPAVEGVPWVVLVLVFFFVLWTFVLSRTGYGRHIYAVGGNEEASRRAGIAVDRVRISAFVLCSLMAAVGGIMIGSNVAAVSVAELRGQHAAARRRRGRDRWHQPLRWQGPDDRRAHRRRRGRGHPERDVQPRAGQQRVVGPVHRDRHRVDVRRRGRRAFTPTCWSGRPGVSGPLAGGRSESPAARPDAIRRHNLALILGHVHRDGELTRAELTQRLGVSRSTIGALVSDLMRLGLVEERVPTGGSRVGRPSYLVGPHTNGPFVVAVDVDVTRRHLGGRRHRRDGDRSAHRADRHQPGLS